MLASEHDVALADPRVAARARGRLGWRRRPAEARGAHGDELDRVAGEVVAVLLPVAGVERGPDLVEALGIDRHAQLVALADVAQVRRLLDDDVRLGHAVLAQRVAHLGLQPAQVAQHALAVDAPTRP